MPFGEGGGLHINFLESFLVEPDSSYSKEPPIWIWVQTKILSNELWGSSWWWLEDPKYYGLG